MDPQSPLLLNAAGLTMKSLPKWTEKDFYFWYYGTYAMSMVGGQYWTEWNREMSKTLLKNQFTVGERAGSWDAIGDKYNRSQAYCTAMGALCLEVVMRRTAK